MPFRGPVVAFSHLGHCGIIEAAWPNMTVCSLLRLYVLGSDRTTSGSRISLNII